MTRPFDTGTYVLVRNCPVCDAPNGEGFGCSHGPFDPTTGEPDPFTDEPYVPEKWPVGWDVLAAVVIAAACIAFGWWAFLR